MSCIPCFFGATNFLLSYSNGFVDILVLLLLTSFFLSCMVRGAVQWCFAEKTATGPSPRNRSFTWKPEFRSGDEVISDEVKHNYQNRYQLQDNCHLILWEIRKGKCELVGCCWHDWRRFHNFLMVTRWRSQQWWRWWWAPGSRPRRQRQRTCSKIGRGWVSTPRKGCPSSSARGTSWWWSQIQRW